MLCEFSAALRNTEAGTISAWVSCKDTAYRGTTDAESSGDCRLADTGAVQFVDLVGMQGGRDGASQTSAVLAGMCEAGTDSFA